MFIELIQTQLMTLMIVALFIWQKNGKLEKEERRSLLAWLFHLILGNIFLYCVFKVDLSTFNSLMIASLNGLATIIYLFLQKITIKKVCYK